MGGDRRPDAEALEFDLACIYTGPVGDQMGEQFIAANPDYGSPPYWPGVGFFVNNNPRTRPCHGAGLRPSQRILERRCRRHRHVRPTRRPGCPADYEAPTGWLNIVNGQATWFLGECPHD